MLSIFKNKIVLYLTLIMLGVILILGTVNYFMIQKISDLNYERERWENNYNASIDSIRKLKDEFGNTIVKKNALILEKDEIINSRDRDIQKLNKVVKQQGKKISDLELMLSVTYDTTMHIVVKPVIQYLPGITQYIEYDSISVGQSYITRVKNSIDSLARYNIVLRGKLYMFYDRDEKVGKWEFKNIFKPRKKEPIFTVVTDSTSLINITDMKVVVIDRRNKCF